MPLKSLFIALVGILGFTSNVVNAKEASKNLMVVLRESEGLNKTDSTLSATGPFTLVAEGKEVTLNMAWFEFIGDMHIRFVYDNPDSMENISYEEFSSLAMTPEATVQVAVQNIRATYGKPKYKPWKDGVMIVSGKSADVDSSYFLDTDFWNDVTKKYPEGVISAVPKRGGLLFAPVSDTKAVDGLKIGIRSLYLSSERMRVSSALYLFKDGKWSVFQSAPKQAGP